MAALRVRKERDRGRIATMLQLSGSSVTGMYVSLAWLITFGVVAGIQGDYWNDGWFWISIGLLVLVIGEMSAVARPYYQRVKEAVEVRPSGVPRRSDEELEEILRSRVARVERGVRRRRARGDHLADDLQAVPGLLATSSAT